MPYLATLGPARALMETRCGTSLPARRCILGSIRWRGNATQKQHSEADALTCTRPMLTGSKKNQASQDLSFSPLIWDASPLPPDENMPSDLPFLTSLLSSLYHRNSKIMAPSFIPAGPILSSLENQTHDCAEVVVSIQGASEAHPLILKCPQTCLSKVPTLTVVGRSVSMG